MRTLVFRGLEGNEKPVILATTRMDVRSGKVQDMAQEGGRGGLLVGGGAAGAVPDDGARLGGRPRCSDPRGCPRVMNFVDEQTLTTRPVCEALPSRSYRNNLTLGMLSALPCSRHSVTLVMISFRSSGLCRLQRTQGALCAAVNLMQECGVHDLLALLYLALWALHEFSLRNGRVSRLFPSTNCRARMRTT